MLLFTICRSLLETAAILCSVQIPGLTEKTHIFLSPGPYSPSYVCISTCLIFYVCDLSHPLCVCICRFGALEALLLPCFILLLLLCGLHSHLPKSSQKSKRKSGPGIGHESKAQVQVSSPHHRVPVCFWASHLGSHGLSSPSKII